MAPTFRRTRAFLGVLALTVATGWFIEAAIAAEWREPTAVPPGGNPPGFVWTQSPDAAAQPGGQFNIIGNGKIGGVLQALGMSEFGNTILDLGSAAGGQNVLYGVAFYDGMHATGDALLLLQTARVTDPAIGPEMTSRLRVTRDGDVLASGRVGGAQICIGDAGGADCKDAWPSGTITEVRAGSNLTGGGAAGAVTIGLSDSPVIAGSLTVNGKLVVKGCFGPIFRGRTAATYQGNAGGAPGGYVQANSRCPTGQHVCTTAEVLNSINCAALASAGVASGTDLWIANFAPSLPTPTNDCIGWTTASPDWRGIKWRLDTTTGGVGYAEQCSVALPFACCG